MESHKMFKAASKAGQMPEVVTIEMPGFQDVETLEEVPSMCAKVKGSIDFRSRLAIEADPDVWQHILGGTRAWAKLAPSDHEGDADSSNPGAWVSWRAGKGCFVARRGGHAGKSKNFNVPGAASQATKDEIKAKAREWANKEEKAEEDAGRSDGEKSEKGEGCSQSDE